jgi:hypothetical protein
MFRRLFPTAQSGNPNGLAEHNAEPNSSNGTGRRRLAEQAPKPARTGRLGEYVSFDEIYSSTPAAEPEGEYSIVKVAAMLKSNHLAGMSMDTKRAALMMALEAAGVEVKDILQDAMLRQRALNDYEETQQKILREFECAKNEENRQIQAELDKVTASYMARVQNNVDEMGQQQDAFRAWQKTKQQESAAIAEATTYCNVPESGIENLSVVLERPLARR